MRLSRRGVLLGLAGVPLAGPVSARDPEQPRLPVSILARAIDRFEPRSPEKRRFGQMIFRGGLQLSGSHPRFGGFSGLWRAPQGGAELVAITDNGFWLTARARSEGGRMVALEEAEMAPILGASGKPLHRSRYYDTESLTIANGEAYIGVERTHDVLRFAFGRDGVSARAQLVPVPREVKKLPNNRGLEAIGVVPAGHALAGHVVAVAERSAKEDEPTLGVILGRQAGQFRVARHDGYDITDLAFLPGGDMLLLERWYKPLRGVGMRVRRIAGSALKAGALLDGPYLIEADLGQEIDNMEGMAVHLDRGKTVVSLISDDNFSFIQRTILLEFELAA